MSHALYTPKTLLEVVTFFADEQRAFEAIRDRRWPNGKVACPLCGCEKVKFMEKVRRWNCNGCRKQFSAKTGTIFEESPISFSKWLPAMWLIANAKNGISSYELHRSLGVTQKTAWFMLHRIRLAMQNESIEKLSGQVEADETYVGGKASNMHKDVRQRKIGDITGFKGKTAVAGTLQRGGKVIAHVIDKASMKTLEPIVRQNVQEGSQLFTDALLSYKNMHRWFDHQFIDHGIAYVEGQIHTNGLENFWSLLKRTVKGTYVSVEPFHLFRYLDEQVFRFNERKGKDADRFNLVVKSVIGRRVTYRELTGKECPPARA